MSKKRLYIALLTLVALVLECIPYGVPMRWATDGGAGIHVEWYAYFSPLPFGYGNFTPLATALLTLLFGILGLFYLWLEEGKTLLRICAVLAFVSSVLALGFHFIWHGAGDFPFLGLVIALIWGANVFFILWKTAPDET